MANVSTAGIEQVLGGVDYPVSKQELIEHAKNSNDSNQDVIDVLNQMPDREYNSPVDVNKEVGKIE